MTVSTETAKVTYNGNGATTSFPVTFPFLEDSHVLVVLKSATGVETTWTDGVQYTLTGAGEASGTLTVDTSPTDYTPASGTTLTISRDVPYTQATDYVNNASFDSETLEDALDKLTMQTQQLKLDVSNAVRVSRTVTDNPTLEFNELAADRAGKALVFNAAGTAIALTDVAGITELSDDMEAFIESATDAAARTELGLGTMAVQNSDAVSMTKPTANTDGSDVFAAFTKTGVETWSMKYSTSALRGSFPALGFAADSQSDLTMYLVADSTPGANGTRLWVWDPAIAVPLLPHTGVYPTFAFWGDMLGGDYICIEVNPMTMFMRVSTGLAVTAVTQLFCARYGNVDTDGGAVILLTPCTGGTDNDGGIDAVTFGRGSGSLANCFRIRRRVGVDTVGTSWTSDGSGHLFPGANQTQDLGTLGTAELRNVYALTVSASSVKLWDTNTSHRLAMVAGSNLSADRTLTLTTGDASRTLTLTGDATVNQDVSTTGSPTFTATTATTATVGGVHRLMATPATASNFVWEQAIAIASVTAAEKIIEITPSAVAGAYTRGILEFAVGGSTGGVGNGATTSKYYFDIANGAPTVGVMVAAVNSGNAPAITVTVVGNVITVNLASNNGVGSFGGTLYAKLLLPKTEGSAITYSIGVFST